MTKKKPLTKAQRIRQRALRTRQGRDAEGTKRLPHIQAALEAGLLNALPADKPRGRYRRRG